MTIAVVVWLELLATVGLLILVFLGFVFGLFWIWNR